MNAVPGPTILGSAIEPEASAQGYARLSGILNACVGHLESWRRLCLDTDLQGLKPMLFSWRLSARLKSCPVTKPLEQSWCELSLHYSDLGARRGWECSAELFQLFYRD